jgi:hypothetical protein
MTYAIEALIMQRQILLMQKECALDRFNEQINDIDAAIEALSGKPALEVTHIFNMVDMAIGKRIFNKIGSWYLYDGEKIGRGTEEVREILAGNPLLLQEIELRIKQS